MHTDKEDKGVQESSWEVHTALAGQTQRLAMPPQGAIPCQPESLEGRRNAGQKANPGSLSQTNHLGHALGMRNAMKLRHEFPSKPRAASSPSQEETAMSTKPTAAACSDPVAKRQPRKLRRIIRVYAQGQHGSRAEKASSLLNSSAEDLVPSEAGICLFYIQVVSNNQNNLSLTLQDVMRA